MKKSSPAKIRLHDFLICPICGNEFYCPPSQIKRAKCGFNVCSKKCFGISRIGVGAKEKIERKCDFCGKPFLILPCRKNRSKYCSKICFDAKRKPNIKIKKREIIGWHSWNWNGGEKKTNCLGCGKEFIARRGRKKIGPAKYCSRKCYWSKRVFKKVLHSSGNGGKRADLNGVYFRSTWEANWARYLNYRISLGEIQKWEFEPDTFEFIGIKRGCRFYTPDFKITKKNGEYEYHEIKGYMDQRSKTKLKRMKKYYPGETVILIDRKVYGEIAKVFKSILHGWEITARKAW